MAYVAQQSLAAHAITEQTGQPLSETQRMFGDPASSEIVLLVTSRHLDREALSVANMSHAYQQEEMRKRHRSKSTRIAEAADPMLIVTDGGSDNTGARMPPPLAKARIMTGAGILGQTKKPGTGGRKEESIMSKEDFFKDDYFGINPLPETLSRLEVRRLPQVLETLAAYRERTQNPAQRRAWLEFGVEKTPRPDIPTLTPLEREEWFMPPRPGIDRLCSMGGRCKCWVDEERSGHGYTGREFIPPRGRRPKIPLCIHCTDDAEKKRSIMYQKLRYQPPISTQSYTVPLDDWPMGYNQRDDVLQVEQDRRLAGVISPYPNYREGRYGFRRIPDEMARRHGFWDEENKCFLPDAPTHFKTELGMDFR